MFPRIFPSPQGLQLITVILISCFVVAYVRVKVCKPELDSDLDEIGESSLGDEMDQKPSSLMEDMSQIPSLEFQPPLNEFEEEVDEEKEVKGEETEEEEKNEEEGDQKEDGDQEEESDRENENEEEGNEERESEKEGDRESESDEKGNREIENEEYVESEEEKSEDEKDTDEESEDEEVGEDENGYRKSSQRDEKESDRPLNPNKSTYDVERVMAMGVMEQLSRIFEKNCNPQELILLPATDGKLDKVEAVKELVSPRRTSSFKVTECPRKVKPSALKMSKPVGLVSFPGSGNTWTRNLLQQLTGLETGSVYNDAVLKKTSFPGEGKREYVVAVKSHEGALDTPRTDWSRVLLVIRNPYDAIVSTFKYQQGNHTSEKKIDRNDPDFLAFFKKQASWKWPSFMRLALSHNVPTLIVLYEDMVENLLPELVSMANFLMFPGYQNLESFSFCCAVQNPAGAFHRNKTSPNEPLFSEEMKELLNGQIEELSKDIKSRFPALSRRLLEYIML